MITLKDVKENQELDALIRGAQKQLNAIGYTEHGHRHISIVSKRAGDILEKLGYPERTVELTRIAGYMHDIGNCVNRVDHAHTGAILAYNILREMGMPIEEITEIMMAIGNHDENTGTAVSDISAALILADKSDVHRDRVVNKNLSTFDIHDRVNYAVTNADLIMDEKERKIKLDSHMIKNTEWGAVAYLSSSKYGKTDSSGNRVRVYNNPYYNNTTNYSPITGLAGKTPPLQSF